MQFCLIHSLEVNSTSYSLLNLPISICKKYYSLARHIPNIYILFSEVTPWSYSTRFCLKCLLTKKTQWSKAHTTDYVIYQCLTDQSLASVFDCKGFYRQITVFSKATLSIIFDWWKTINGSSKLINKCNIYCVMKIFTD